ncbi:MAG TPA: response regulator [Anaerolineae bacterium]|nr:response regulator [Anaerolineae bacterium]
MQEIRMLLVDDEDDFRTTLAKRLKLRKVNITDVASGNEAIELVKQNSFDVAVIDVKMPGIDGIETLKQIKQIQPAIEIVMLTGHASIGSGMEAMKLGAYDYVMKPCDIDELLIKTGEAYQHKLLKEKEK